jgi:hypothetical protein
MPLMTKSSVKKGSREREIKMDDSNCNCISHDNALGGI